MLKLKASPQGFARKMVVELWLYPDGTRILELSTKCAPDEAFQVAAEGRAFLTERGIEVGGAQTTKTRKALEFFSKQLKEGLTGNVATRVLPDRQIRSAPGVARHRVAVLHDRALGVEDPQRPLHRDRLDLAQAGAIGVVERVDRRQGEHDHRGRRPHQHRLGSHALAAVREEQHEAEDDARDQDQDEPDRRRDDALRAVEPIVPAVLAVRSLVEVLPIRGLLGGGLRVRRPQRLEEGGAPGVDRVAALPRHHLRPLLVHDRARVADQLARQPVAHRGWEQLRGLELLDHGDRLGLRAAARLVVGREGEEDDEAGEDREAAGEHAEHPEARSPSLK